MKIERMRFSLIICTFKRKDAVKRLLASVQKQILYPDEIIVVDASPDDQTSASLASPGFKNLKYFKVDDNHKGLTRQRNFGISKTSRNSEIICFLDDDIELKMDYFLQLIRTYELFPEASGVGGYICEEGTWENLNPPAKKDVFIMDGWSRKLGKRNIIRRKLGLLSNRPPGQMADFSHSLSINFLPPSGKIYPVDFFMGGVSSFKKEVFAHTTFSHYFEGYGLYEDLDFCLRLSKIGQLYVNTSAQVYHNHDASGRPNYFNYGKMVVRNGWYVWRINNPNPGIKARIKWHAITLLLMLLRLGNGMNLRGSKGPIADGLGRGAGWLSLFINRPRHEN